MYHDDLPGLSEEEKEGLIAYAEAHGRYGSSVTEATLGSQSSTLDTPRTAVEGLAKNRWLCRAFGDSEKQGPGTTPETPLKSHQAVSKRLGHTANGLWRGRLRPRRLLFTKKPPEANRLTPACNRTGGDPIR